MGRWLLRSSLVELVQAKGNQQSRKRDFFFPLKRACRMASPRSVACSGCSEGAQHLPEVRERCRRSHGGTGLRAGGEQIAYSNCRAGKPVQRSSGPGLSEVRAGPESVSWILSTLLVFFYLQSRGLREVNIEIILQLYDLKIKSTNYHKWSV